MPAFGPQKFAQSVRTFRYCRRLLGVSPPVLLHDCREAAVKTGARKRMSFRVIADNIAFAGTF